MVGSAKTIENDTYKFPLNIITYPFRYFSDKWYARVVIDRNIIQDLVAFYNSKMGYVDYPLNYRDAVCLARVAGRINADLWNVLNPKTEEEINKFYNILPWYPFELAYWHMTGYQKLYRKIIVEHCFGHVLDYGGGIGDLCLKLARKGLKVAYADVEGVNFEFAKWLFARNKKNIRMIDLSRTADLPDTYNTILCIDMIGHVTKPEELIRKLAAHLAENGRLIITQLRPMLSPEDNPMHLRIKFDAEGLFESLNLIRINDYSRDLAILEKRTHK